MTTYILSITAEPDSTHTSLRAARAAYRRGTGRVYASHWYAVDDGEACSVYSSLAAMRADVDGSRGARITRVAS